MTSLVDHQQLLLLNELHLRLLLDQLGGLVAQRLKTVLGGLAGRRRPGRGHGGRPGIAFEAAAFEVIVAAAAATAARVDVVRDVGVVCQRSLFLLWIFIDWVESGGLGTLVERGQTDHLGFFHVLVPRSLVESYVGARNLGEDEFGGSKVAIAYHLDFRGDEKAGRLLDLLLDFADDKVRSVGRRSKADGHASKNAGHRRSIIAYDVRRSPVEVGHLVLPVEQDTDDGVARDCLDDPRIEIEALPSQHPVTSPLAKVEGLDFGRGIGTGRIGIAEIDVVAAAALHPGDAGALAEVSKAIAEVVAKVVVVFGGLFHLCIVQVAALPFLWRFPDGLGAVVRSQIRLRAGRVEDSLSSRQHGQCLTNDAVVDLLTLEFLEPLSNGVHSYKAEGLLVDHWSAALGILAAGGGGGGSGDPSARPRTCR